MPLNFEPPLLNSASPWATSSEDMRSLYHCPSTGAVTTRTCLLHGSDHNPSIHQHCFVANEDTSIVLDHSVNQNPQSSPHTANSITSLNTYAYSPSSLLLYLPWATNIIEESHKHSPSSTTKPFIFSVTGTPSDIVSCYWIIVLALDNLHLKGYTTARFLMEINLSCPNIANKPPPAYSRSILKEYLAALKGAQPSATQPSKFPAVPVGIKTPPYTYTTQFTDMISALLSSCSPPPAEECPISFITATNTLGSSLVLTPIPSPVSGAGYTNFAPALASASGTGIGGLAGCALHPLALGNVATLRQLLDVHEELRGVEIIGVGGVADKAGYDRMRSVGAAAVGVGTALGVEGLNVFERILSGVKQEVVW